MYCMLVPAAPIIVFNLFFMETLSMRIALLYEERRPLNRSHRIIPFIDTLRYIYFIGLMVTCWSIFFNIEFAVKTWQPLIEELIVPISDSGVFMFNFIATVALAAAALLAGELVNAVVEGFTDSTLLGKPVST